MATLCHTHVTWLIRPAVGGAGLSSHLGVKSALFF